jgi:hypothetical protein
MAIFGFVQNPKQFCTGAVSCYLFSLSKNTDGVGVGVAWGLAHADRINLTYTETV